MEAPQLAEWAALGKIEEEEERRAELAAKADSRVQNHKRRG